MRTVCLFISGISVPCDLATTRIISRSIRRDYFSRLHRQGIACAEEEKVEKYGVLKVNLTFFFAPCVQVDAPLKKIDPCPSRGRNQTSIRRVFPTNEKRVPMTPRSVVYCSKISLLKIKMSVPVYIAWIKQNQPWLRCPVAPVCCCNWPYRGLLG